MKSLIFKVFHIYLNILNIKIDNITKILIKTICKTFILLY